MLRLKNALLDSLIERLVFLAANEECEAIQQAYLKELRRVELMRSSSAEAEKHAQSAYGAKAVLG